MKYYTLLYIAVFILVTGIYACITDTTKKQKNASSLGAMSIGLPNEKYARFNWEQKRLANPLTGKIPQGIRKAELAFAKSLETPKINAKTNSLDTIEWTARGPNNIGGRTRALAIDVTNENIILAGGVSGGLWRTEDSGQTWEQAIAPEMGLAVTCIAQDTRNGHTDTWYFGTGEGYGASASGGGSYYSGNGVYKSTDGGKTWAATGASNFDTPHTFDTPYDMIWNIVTDPTAPTDEEVVLIATYNTLYRSTNGGLNWKQEKSISGAYATDIAVSKNGLFYATFSGDNGQAGIYRSTDGDEWINITPEAWPDEFGRTVIGINPSDDKEVYFLASETEGFGLETFNFLNDPEWNSLWKYTYIGGNGSGAGGQWEDRSQNLPKGPHPFDDFNAQGGYDLLIKVHPTNSNVVFIGGTNIYRSTDAFATPVFVQHLGGYVEDTYLPLFDIVENHHPDQHNIVFLPSNPNTILSSHDGGISKTEDCMAEKVEWTNLNNGYRTTQFYTLAIDRTSLNDEILGGLQDNGTMFTNSANPANPWALSFTYDGAFCAIPDGGGIYYMSIQSGRMLKATLTDEGELNQFNRIDPIGGKDYLFINPFILDPNDQNKMYLAAGAKLWRNDDLASIPLEGKFDSISTGWFQLTDTLPQSATKITSLAASENPPAHRLYIGTDNQKVYKIDNANEGNPMMQDITGEDFPKEAYVTDIEVDPTDGNKVFVLFSNYGVYSMFYSVTGGTQWTKVAGNLEANANGSGAGPSFRSLSVLHIDKGITEEKHYFLGTSTGLYYTAKINGTETLWDRVPNDIIGTTVVEVMESRPTDGLVLAGTHGNGVFSAKLNPQPETGLNNNLNNKVIFNTYPNPIQNTLYVKVDNAILKDNPLLKLYDINGQLLKQFPFSKQVDVSGLSSGIYFLILETKNIRLSKKIEII